MDTQSTLSMAAEIGIGVAGFSSIATAVLSRTRAEQIETRWVQMRTLLVTSLAVVLLAYLPMVLGASAMSAATIWLIASGIYAAWVFFTVSMFLGGYRALSLQPGHQKYLANVTLVLALTSLTLNCINVVVWQQSWPYLAALGCAVLVTFMQFVSLVRSFWDTAG